MSARRTAEDGRDPWATEERDRRGAPAGGSAPAGRGRDRALSHGWNAALATGDADRVAALYTPDAVLLPTLSAENRVGREAVAAYSSEDLLPEQPQGEVTGSEVRVLDEDSALHTADHTLTSGTDGSVVRARVHPGLRAAGRRPSADRHPPLLRRAGVLTREPARPA